MGEATDPRRRLNEDLERLGAIADELGRRAKARRVAGEALRRTLAAAGRAAERHRWIVSAAAGLVAAALLLRTRAMRAAGPPAKMARARAVLSAAGRGLAGGARASPVASAAVAGGAAGTLAAAAVVRWRAPLSDRPPAIERGRLRDVTVVPPAAPR